MAGKTTKDVNLEFGVEDAEEKKVPVKTAPKKSPVKRSKKVRIIIDEVTGMSNYETLSHNGSAIQVRRGVPVEVDEKYVHVLELAVQTVKIQSKDRITGEPIEEERNFSAIPWRRA